MCSFFRRFIGTKKEAKVCDLGCGDAVLAEQLLSLDHSIDLTLVDGSAEMLQAAERRLVKLNADARYVRASFGDVVTNNSALGAERFDFIVSGFAIHHVEDADKWSLFQAIFDRLQPNGWFMNIEGVLPDNVIYGDWHFEPWRECVLEFEKLRKAERSLSEFVDFTRQDPDNRFTQLTNQLRSLSRVGFQKVECHYRNGIFAIYTAQKGETFSQ